MSAESDCVTIVSGLPRSGTSLVMQMLHAGGMPVLTDGVRAADVDNPRGYFEFELVKHTAADASWVRDAKGCAVKMASPLLRVLPVDCFYRVVLTRRDPAEVVASQNAMLRRMGKPLGPITDYRLAALLDDSLADTERWLAGRANFVSLMLPHAMLIGSPLAAAGQLSAFCGGLDARAMAAVVEPALYRHRRALKTAGLRAVDEV